MNVHAKRVQVCEMSLKVCNYQDTKKFLSTLVCITSCCDVQSGKPLNLCMLQEQLLNYI